MRAELSDTDLFNAESYPMPFEKFFYVAKLHALRYTGTSSLRRLSDSHDMKTVYSPCNHLVLEKRPVGFSLANLLLPLSTRILSQETYEYHFGVMPSPGSCLETIPALEQKLTKVLDPEELLKSEGFPMATSLTLRITRSPCLLPTACSAPSATHSTTTAPPTPTPSATPKRSPVATARSLNG
jgi:hypothetical protein